MSDDTASPMANHAKKFASLGSAKNHNKPIRTATARLATLCGPLSISSSHDPHSRGPFHDRVIAAAAAIKAPAFSTISLKGPYSFMSPQNSHTNGNSGSVRCASAAGGTSYTPSGSHLGGP